MRRALFISDFATAPFWISLYMRKFFLSLLSVQPYYKNLHSLALFHSSSPHESMNFPKIVISLLQLFLSHSFRPFTICSKAFYSISQCDFNFDNSSHSSERNDFVEVLEHFFLLFYQCRKTIISACRMKKWITHVPGVTGTLCDQQLPRDSCLLQNRCNKKILY